MNGMNPVAQGIVSKLDTLSTLLMRMRVLSWGKNYDVMDQDKQVLCQIGLDGRQNMKGQLIGAAVSQVAGDWVGRWATRSLAYTYDVRDASGALAMQIRKTPGGQKAQFHVLDPQNSGSFGYIDLKRSLIGGLKAAWVGPNGQPLMHTKGNIVRRKYAIQGPAGENIGRVRHKILAVRDVWQLELDQPTNHLYSALFATVLDFEKKM